MVGALADSFGTARLPNDSTNGTICWSINTENLELPIAGTLIHAAGPGQVGTAVLELFPAADTPDPTGCKTITDTALLRDLNWNSQEYYLEIHDAGVDQAPDGAIRGQLRVEKFEEV